MTAESQNFGAVLNKLAVEQNVIRPYVDQIQTDLVSAMSDTATAIDGEDTESNIAAAATTALPLVRAIVDELAQYTTAGTPTL